MNMMATSTGTADAAWSTEELEAAIQNYEAYGYRVSGIRVGTDGADPVNRVDFSYDGSAPGDDDQIAVRLASEAAPEGKQKIFSAKAFVDGKLKTVVLYR